MEPTSSLSRFDSSHRVTDLATQLAEEFDEQGLDLFAGNVRATFNQPTTSSRARHLQLELQRLKHNNIRTRESTKLIMATLLSRLELGINQPLQEVYPLYESLRNLLDELTLYNPTLATKLFTTITQTQFSHRTRLERLDHFVLMLTTKEQLPDNIVRLAQGVANRLSGIHKPEKSCEVAVYALTPSLPSTLLNPQNNSVSSTKQTKADFTFEMPERERFTNED